MQANAMCQMDHYLVIFIKYYYEHPLKCLIHWPEMDQKLVSFDHLYYILLLELVYLLSTLQTNERGSVFVW